MKSKFIKGTLIILLIITVLLFVTDSFIDVYGVSENEKIIFDWNKIQDYTRSLAISSLVLFVTIIIIEVYFRKEQEEVQKEESEIHLNKAVELLLFSLNKYQKSLYFLLHTDSRKDKLNYPVNFPFKYLENIFDINFNISNSFLTKTRIEEYIESYDNFKNEIHTIYLNDNLKADSKLFFSLKALIHELNEYENFGVLIDYSKKAELKKPTLEIISISENVPELTPSNIINPCICLYNSINSILKFKENIRNL